MKLMMADLSGNFFSGGLANDLLMTLYVAGSPTLLAILSIDEILIILPALVCNYLSRQTNPDIGRAN